MVEEIIYSNYVGAVPISKFPSLGVDVLDSIEAWKAKGPSRAFGVNVKVWHPNGGQKMSIGRDMVLVDQGSDITIIYPPLPKVLGLKVYPMSNLLESNTKLIMNTTGIGWVQLTK